MRTLEEKGKGRGRKKPEHFDISDDGPQHDPSASSSGGPPVLPVADGDGEEESPQLLEHSESEDDDTVDYRSDEEHEEEEWYGDHSTFAADIGSEQKLTAARA